MNSSRLKIVSFLVSLADSSQKTNQHWDISDGSMKFVFISVVARVFPLFSYCTSNKRAKLIDQQSQRDFSAPVIIDFSSFRQKWEKKNGNEKWWFVMHDNNDNVYFIEQKDIRAHYSIEDWYFEECRRSKKKKKENLQINRRKIQSIDLHEDNIFRNRPT